MRIGIDARLLGERGIGRYIEQLIKHLEEIDNENQYYIFLTKKNFNQYSPKKHNFQKILANYKWYSIKEQLFYPKKLKKYKLDLVHFTHFNVPIFYNKPLIVTLHDLIVLKFPTIRATTLGPVLYNIKKYFLKIILKNAIKKAKNIICVSEFTKKDIIEYFNLEMRDVKKINVIYEGVTLFSKKDIDTQKINLNLADSKIDFTLPYIIYVGSAYPHKNLEKLCEAFKQINDLKLILVGKKDYFYKRLEKEYKDLIGNKIILTDYLNDWELGIYMNNALFYIFPSLYEGFGLPPLEAMQYDLPVLCSNTSCLPEIFRDSVEYFDASNVNNIVNSINKLKNNKNRLDDLRIRGQLYYRRYSWHECTKKTLDLYCKI